MMTTFLLTAIMGVAQPPARPTPPKVVDRDWIQIPFDCFILHEIESARRSPRSEPAPEELQRRLTLALAGRLPTEGEQDAFRKATSKRAYEREVGRLLELPAVQARFADLATAVAAKDVDEVRAGVRRTYRRLLGRPLESSPALDWLTAEVMSPSLVNCCDLSVPAAGDIRHLVHTIVVSAAFRCDE